MLAQKSNSKDVIKIVHQNTGRDYGPTSFSASTCTIKMADLTIASSLDERARTIFGMWPSCGTCCSIVDCAVKKHTMAVVIVSNISPCRQKKTNFRNFCFEMLFKAFAAHRHQFFQKFVLEIFNSTIPRLRNHLYSLKSTYSG